VDRVGYNAPSIQARFRVSRDGRVLVFQSAEPFDTRLTWFNRNGDEIGVLGGPGNYYQFRIAPAGDRVAFSAPDPQTGNRDVWLIEVARGITARLTNHTANDWFPVWSPDGRQVLFGSDRDGGIENVPYLKTSMDTGSGESRHAGLQGTPYDWSADSQWIAYVASQDLHVGRASGSVDPFPFLATPAREDNPRFSPDGKWIAYSSDESGRMEVYVRPFSGQSAAPTGKLQVSDRGGDFAVWGPSSGEIFYMTRDRADIFAVDMRNLGRTKTLSTPVPLFRVCPGTQPLHDSPPFDTRDGQQFLVNCLVEPPGQFTVLMNWTFPKTAR
jgi:Tol biopolymer transport system component